MDNVIIYSKKNCPSCVKAKQLFVLKNQPYTEIILGEDIDIETFKVQYPDQKSVPLIIINGKEVKGYEHLIEHYNSGPHLLQG